jgi:hypothetical protein
VLLCLTAAVVACGDAKAPEIPPPASIAPERPPPKFLPPEERETKISTAVSRVQSSHHPAGTCERETVKLLGRAPVRIEGKIRAPKKLRHVHPSYPKLPSGTVGSGIWIGAVLIDARGKVSQVWVLREPKLTPPYPAFAEAIVDAVRQWEFEPVKVNGVPTPLCMTVATTLHWE